MLGRREFGGGELADDCALVVIKRTATQPSDCAARRASEALEHPEALPPRREQQAGRRPRAPASGARSSSSSSGPASGTLATEICASRLLAPYFGSSTIVWANLIGLVLAALSVGYWLGGKLADRRPTPRLLGALVLASAALVALVPFVTRPILDVAAGGLDELSAGP